MHSECPSREVTTRRRVIPIVSAQSLPSPTQAFSSMSNDIDEAAVADTRGRALHDLRISLTDRCNFRCTYCMPKAHFGPDHVFLAKSKLLSFDQIISVVKAFIAVGLTKVRLTGGEPLLRPHVEELVRMLGSLRTLEDKVLDIAITTNGSALAAKAAALREAGLRRITVSLDGIDDATFRQMNDVNFPVARVLNGIETALSVGISQLKVNMMVKRGVNDTQILPMARHFKGTGVIVRFIEYMDVGCTNGWNLQDVVSSAEVVQRIGTAFPIEEVTRHGQNDTARRWRYRDGSGEIGVISSVTDAFCSTCTRMRLSADGKLYTCLFATHGHSISSLLDDTADPREMQRQISDLWRTRRDNYSERRMHTTPAEGPRVEMWYIGG